MVPHYQMRIIAWIIFQDGWSGSARVSVTLDGNQTQFMQVSSSLVNEAVCGGGPKEDYLRYEKVYTHSAIAPYTVTITTDNASMKWGVKELIMQVKLCHFACDLCFGPLVTNCTSCDQQSVIYMLSGTTCNESCLTGYGETMGGMFCVLCDLKCVICF